VRISVDQSKCQAHGLCSLTAPTLFELGESDGYSYVKVDEVPADEQGAARAAAAGCPERAISVIE
jgi:ferredoxin